MNTKPLIKSVFDLQEGEKLSDFLPSLPILTTGISGFLFVGWLSIWMGAILLNGCMQPYDTSTGSAQAFSDYSQAIDMNLEPATGLDAALERAIASGDEL